MKSLTQFIEESLIKENFGEFKNAQEVATKLVDAIKDNENKNKLEIDVSKFDLPFNLVNIEVSLSANENVKAFYNTEKTLYDSKTITIVIIYNKLNKQNRKIEKLIMHELTHAICDFNLNKLNKSLNHLLISKNFKNVQNCIHAYGVSSKEIYSKHYNIHNKIIYFLTMLNVMHIYLD